MTIAVVVPTARRETSYKDFLEAWMPLFQRYQATLLTVFDGDDQCLMVNSPGGTQLLLMPEEVLGSSQDLLLKHTPACRNLGFAYIAKELPDVEVVITLDDDVRPLGDSIYNHLAVLGHPVAYTYFNTYMGANFYPRGFPYGARKEAEVVLSHGAAMGVADWDAPSQLVLGNPEVPYFQGPVPKRVGFSICGMNLAFQRKLLPYVYYAPVADYAGVSRMDDIFMGHHLKKEMDRRNWAIWTGAGAVLHERASDPFKNLEREAVGIGLNENYWSHQSEPFFTEYADKRKRWAKWIAQWS